MYVHVGLTQYIFPFFLTVQSVKHIVTSFSDLDMIKINFHIDQNISNGRGYWKLNNNLLKDNEFVKG